MAFGPPIFIDGLAEVFRMTLGEPVQAQEISVHLESVTYDVERQLETMVFGEHVGRDRQRDFVWP